jgi:glutamate 5-kinase
MRIVVKLGSSLVATPQGAVRRTLLAARAREVAQLTAGGHSVCIVSSGAIALGAPRLGFARRPSSMGRLQAASAVGQAQLQQAWEVAFRRVGLQAAQILLSPADVADRQTYVNVCSTFDALFRLGAVPVVNENDATATDEITFGDNDSLAAQVAVLTQARLLVLLTEVDGVYSRAPGTPGAELLDDGSLTAAARVGRATGLGRGGMGSKIAAAQLAAGAGIPTVIASGQAASVLVPIVAGERRGTRFDGRAAPGESAFKLWIRHGKRPRGSVVLDAGAERALRATGASVLAVGVTACEGGFGPGDAIELVSASGAPIGKGIASVAAAEVVSRARGLEVVNRDRLVLYQ